MDKGAYTDAILRENLNSVAYAKLYEMNDSLSFNQHQNFSFNIQKSGESIQKMFKSASNESKDPERNLKQEYYKAFSVNSGQNPSEYGLQVLQKAVSNDLLQNQLLPDHQISYTSINDSKQFGK